MPASEDELSTAIADGRLEESHYLDLKREVEAGRAANKELARDLAQFAIDSGTLVIGVDEVPDGPPVLAPVVLEGLPERIEQVAGSTVDAPLFVTTTVIQSSSDPTRGYVLVHIPASASAPHMVDGAYLGRGDKKRVRLSDVEVRRLHAQLAAGEDEVRDAVRAYARRDPVPADIRRNAHLYVLAVPVTPRREMLLDVTDGPEAHSSLSGLVRAGATAAQLPGEFPPSVSGAAEFQRRQDGAAMTTNLRSDRTIDPERRLYEQFLEVEMSDEGTLRIAMGRLSDHLRDGQEVLLESALTTITRQTVDIAGKISEHASYGGLWRFAVLAEGIAGLPAHLHGRGWGMGEVVVGADSLEYLRTTQASTAEVLSAPWEVTSRLVGRSSAACGSRRCQR
ncbi:helix-turn-helix domain-containing protein [Aeromicrobium sp. 50.2.37]|uniref:AlbA family DNA-binding domain-containing protein n=1 Tax=Aeromicrobium sp. 50.2.37 TaxID=2969305 RepID=UPI00215058EB|nr:ATP-binding protein [Aeromicrobium sp. 50.2.37]MCR4512662.1 ATP-binding protein [Aeromicrobium sp. 50.2.37]